jgi:Mn2+/Fe2+ NRAMP family transporter
MRTKTLLRGLGPGLLVAATGVGAGDLATASFTGSELGLSVLWAVLLGAFLKFVLNEGLTRWQLATGLTLLEGCVRHLGQFAGWFFLTYLLVWSFFVSAALMSAVGVTCHAILPLSGTSETAASMDKAIYGALHSLVAVVLVRIGGYRLFETVMNFCVGVMFVSVLATAIALQPDAGEVLSGLVLPRIPPGGTGWTIALIGGVGGTVTILCYGYWIREEGHNDTKRLPLCRLDLAVGYFATALFGISMVVIGNSLGALEGGGARLVVAMAERLQQAFGASGPVMRWVFLAGAWCAVFTSLLGVWQSIPYLFADLWGQLRGGARPRAPISTTAPAYRGYLYALAVVPMLGMWFSGFRAMQQTNAIVGAAFVPLVAAVLLILNGRAHWVGTRYRNAWPTTVILIGTLSFFLYAALSGLGE